jgi:hypothetical protein
MENLQVSPKEHRGVGPDFHQIWATSIANLMEVVIVRRPRSCRGTAMLYGATTSFTVVARTSFTPLLEFLAQEARNDALEDHSGG